MEKNEVSKLPFRVTHEPAGLCIHVPVKSDKVRALLNLVWLLVWAGGEVAIAIIVLRGVRPQDLVSPDSFPLAELFLAAFTVAGGVVLWRYLWCVGGSEVFRVEHDALLVKRGIWRLGHTRAFSYENIERLRAARLKYRLIYPSWGRMFIGHDESEITIVCDGRTYAYGKGLRQNDAADLVDLLKGEISLQLRDPSISKAPSASQR